MEREGVIYCPVCGRDVEAANKSEVSSGEHSGFIFVHDDLPHENDEMKALDSGVH